ncbi:alpha-N-acetylneuraminide alpha-2,8-sialyltransferase-like [Branchiostoma floridae x Branchiostoma japonicum]
MAVGYIGRCRRWSRLPRLHWRSTVWMYTCTVVIAFFLSVLNCIFNPNGLLNIGRDTNRRDHPCRVFSLLLSSKCSYSCDESVAKFPFEVDVLENNFDTIDTEELELTQTKVFSVIEKIFRRTGNSMAAKIRTMDVHTISEILSRKTEEGSMTEKQRELLFRAFEKYSKMDITLKNRHRERKTGIWKNKRAVDDTSVVKDTPVLMYQDESGNQLSVSFRSQIITFQQSYNLTEVKEPLRIWAPNAIYRDFIRQQLLECCTARNNMVATQSNVSPGTTFGWTSHPVPDLSYTVTKNFYSAFPATSPFPSAPFRTCAVVGNSGVLHRSNCGRQIDSADYVFRINWPPTRGKEAHVRDVGLKRNLTTATYHQVKRFQKHSQKKEEVLEMLASLYGLLFIRKPTGYLLAVDQVLQDAGRPLELVYQNPLHYISVNDYWNTHGLHHITITTGLYLISSALTLCEEVTVYGFWPFPFTEFGKKVPFHYWVGHIFLLPRERGVVYDMAAEFMQIRELHRKGVVRVVTDKCEQ